jgi:hypothetical protein
MVMQSEQHPVGTGTSTITGALPAGTNNIGDVDVLSVIPGVGVENLGKSEDAAHGNGDVGIEVLLVRRDTPASSTVTAGDYGTFNSDANGNQWTALGSQIAGEDITNDVMKVEHRYAFARPAADALVKTGAGYLHAVTFQQTDAAPTAGSIILYDNTAESGTVLCSVFFDTTVFRAFTIILDVPFATGLYVGFTTTADIAATVSYR